MKDYSNFLKWARISLWLGGLMACASPILFLAVAPLDILGLGAFIGGFGLVLTCTLALYEIVRDAKPRRIKDRTLEEVVDLYLRELDNPVPDATMRDIYRKWLREFVPEFTATKRGL